MSLLRILQMFQPPALGVEMFKREAGTRDWTDPVEKPEPIRTEKENALLATSSPFVVRNYGNLDIPTMEAIVIGYLVADPDGDGDTRAFSKIRNCGIAKEWFKDEMLAGVFVDLIAYHMKHGSAPSVEAMGVVCQINSHSNDEAREYKHVLQMCQGAVWTWKVPLDLILEKFKDHHDVNGVKKLFDAYLKDAADPTIGVAKAAEKFKQNAVKTVSSDLPPMVRVKDFLDENLPKKQVEMWQGIVRKGAKLFIGAHSKASKTFFQLGLAIAFSKGAPYLGRLTSKCKVLYVNLELDHAEFQDRIQNMKATLGGDIDENFIQWTLKDNAKPIEELGPQIIAECKDAEDRVIFLDPVYMCLGDRNENDAGDMNNFCLELGKIAKETGATVITANHFSKGNQSGKESIDRFAGSGVFGRYADALLTLTPHEQADCYTVSSTLRSFPRIPEFCIKWEYPCWTIDDTINPKALKGINGAEAPCTEEHIMEATPDADQAPVTKDEILARVKDLTTAGGARIRARFGECEFNGKFEVTKVFRSGTNPGKLYRKKGKASSPSVTTDEALPEMPEELAF